MPRYIDAEKVVPDAIQERKFVIQTPNIRNFEMTIQTVYADLADFIAAQPTADVVEVRRGEWKSTNISSYFGGVIYECSLCGAKDGDHSSILGNYCWRCGADMRGNNNG